MGHFSATCAITRTAIVEDEPCIAVIFYPLPHLNPTHPEYGKPRLSERMGGSKREVGQEYYSTYQMRQVLGEAKHHLDEARESLELLVKMRAAYSRGEGIPPGLGDTILPGFRTLSEMMGDPTQFNAESSERWQHYLESVTDDKLTDAKACVQVIRGKYNGYGGMKLADGTEFDRDNIITEKWQYFFVREEVVKRILFKEGKTEAYDNDFRLADFLSQFAMWARIELFDRDHVGTQDPDPESQKRQMLVHAMASEILLDEAEKYGYAHWYTEQ